jgi:hypothetical protein
MSRKIKKGVKSNEPYANENKSDNKQQSASKTILRNDEKQKSGRVETVRTEFGTE